MHQISRIVFLLLIGIGITLSAAFCLLFWGNNFSFVGISDLFPCPWSSKKYNCHVAFQSPDGPVYVARVITGPFDLHRKYFSMEGPYTHVTCNVASLVASKKICLPKSGIGFTELNGVNSMNERVMHSENPRGIKGFIHLSGHPRQLYWFKGLELTVLDEDGKPMSSTEFMCHFILDVRPKFRNRIFNTAEQCRIPRIISLTQGQTKFFFPDGYGVPVASDELLRLAFQAANRTASRPRRIRHICQLYFLKDSQTAHSIQALQWDCPFMAVALNKDAHQPSPHSKTDSCCVGYTAGTDASNGRGKALFHDPARGFPLLSGHWVVPLGLHTFHAPYYTERTFKNIDDFVIYPRTIHAAWCHIHPLCTEASLIEHTGMQRKILFTVHVKTHNTYGPIIASIENICSEQGIFLAGTAKGKQYELETVYNNTTDKPIDAMVAMGIFAVDQKFRKPNWAVLENAIASLWGQ